MAKKIVTSDLDKVHPETSSQRILLEEYRFLQNHYLNNRDQGIERMNFFITAVSVAVGGVLVFGSSSKYLPINYFKLILFVTLILLDFIGFDLYRYLIHRDISADRDERGLARIRKYFIDLDPKIKGVFVTRCSDSPTTYLTHTGAGIRRVTQVIDGFLLGLAMAVLVTFLPLAIEVAFGIGFITALLVFLILDIGARRRLRARLMKVQQHANEN